ncbi:MAG: PAS domain S-box protein, partial [Proteobacteria bacterium]|nr:PAS domain S-box protein [Pseudomonadota bacterium]
RQKLDVLFPEASRDESIGKIARTLEGEYWEAVELPILHKDGDIRVALWNSANIYSGEGKTLSATIAQGVDITERKRVEEALRESEERYRLLAENVTDIIWIMDMNLRFTYISPSITKMTDFSVEEAMGLTLADGFTPASIEVARNVLAEELTMETTGKADPFRTRTLELEVFRKDGSKIWTEAKMTFLRDQTGQAAGIFGVSRDICRRKRTEEALRESEKLYRGILETAPDSITITRVKDGRYLQVNEAFCQMSGYSREEALGRTPFDMELFTNPGDRERFIKILKEKREVNGFEVQYRKKDGTTADTLLSARPLEYGKEECLVAVVTDVTKLKRTEGALEKRLAYEKMLADISTRAVFVEDIDRCLDECLESMGKTLKVNRIYIFEYSHESGTVSNTIEWVSEGIPPQKANLQKLPVKLFRWWMEKMKNNQIINFQDIEDIPGEQEKAILRPQGIKSILVVPLFVNNNLYGFIGYDECQYHRKWLDEDLDILKTTVQIITKTIETKQAEEALRESEEKYRLLVENASDAIFIFQDQKVKFPNPKAIELGRNLAVDLERVPFLNYVHPEDRQMVIERHSKRLKGEKVPDTYSFRLMNRDGEELWAELNAVLINWEGKPATLNFLRDITLQQQLEAQIQQIRRLEALGTLAGGIAHDFNNLLMGIQGRTSLMMMNNDFSQVHYEDLKGIEDIVKSGVDLTKQLLGFGRKGKYEAKPTDLSKLVHTSSQMFGRTKKEIKIHAKYQKDIWAAEVARGQIQQVLLNLYVNAWQAMPGGGELYLQTENVTFDESYTNPYEVKPGRYVKVSVVDTGVGMDEATKERIFEPFFTTKEMGRGMGLGLASAYGIIKNHEGILNVYSERGEGTTFNIYLPACEKKIIDEKKPLEGIIRGTETVLLVDDEDIIVDIWKKNLEKLGYKVITARNGKEAIELYKKNQGNIDIVVLDMIMPEMGGGETYDRLKEINPDVKVILSSGYSIEGQASEILKRGCDGFIQKPFRMKQLSRKINEVLEKE